MGGRLLLLSAATCAALTVAGCGDGDSTTGGDVSVSSLTKAEFIKQGDTICKKGNDQIEREVEVFVKENGINRVSPTDEDQNEVTAAVVVPAFRDQAEKLADLEAPSGLEDEVDAMIDALETGIDEVEDDPAALFRSEVSPMDEANELAIKLGFTECGKR
jgi:hypothetical protein